MNKLRDHVLAFKENRKRTILSEDKLDKTNALNAKFKIALADDLNMPQALAVVWEVVKSNIPDYDKYDLLKVFDDVLGLNLGKVERTVKVDKVVTELVNQREKLRKEGKFDQADDIRKKIFDLGFTIEDKADGPVVKRR